MSKMITVASGFQYSVNIGYDLNNDDKLKNLIPTRSALELLEEILLSTNPVSNERARILVGAYGKGKSHIVLMILAILMKRDLKLFKKVMPRVKENTKLYKSVQNYYESDNKILPIIITGSSTNLSQSFLLALHRALSVNGLLNVMPETNYKAAISVIVRWKNEFPNTYEKLKDLLDTPINIFVEELQNYSIRAYEKFEEIYTVLTAGSLFNPFIGFDVVDLYEEAIKGLKSKGYTGLYVIYDEFSKFLEANITKASVIDTKMIQDFAEKCNRSGDIQLHLMLISHKEIANYIDKLPKQKVDGWRGVSERFKHIHLNNNFIQTYEIIESAIHKSKTLWRAFCDDFTRSFANLIQRYQKHNIFSDLPNELVEKIIYGCYPLHPVSTFILPRLSERIAQNERTLFTFISASGRSTLLSFLEKYNDDFFDLITPDRIYDYFEPLLKKEVYSGKIYENYYLTELILEKLEIDSLESKVVKTLSLIYILEQFEKLQPSKDELVSIYSTKYSTVEINAAIDNLIDKEYVIYLRRSNDFLKLKQTSGVDIRSKINDLIEKQKDKAIIKETLNKSNFDNYMYPSRYNHEYDMTRYFAFEYIDADEITEDIDWKVKSENIDVDGVIYGIIVHNENSIDEIKQNILRTSQNCEGHIFIIPKHYYPIEDIVREFNAVSFLRDEANYDGQLFDEYEIIHEDLKEVLSTFMRGYTRPEEYRSDYIFKGDDKLIKRKSVLTELMSKICSDVFSSTPIINNEVMNRNEITSMANNSRSKIISALLRNELEPNLGFTSKSGQEVSVMRSTLIRTGILEENNGMLRINLRPSSLNNINVLLMTIENFIIETRQSGRMSFIKLYNKLRLPKYQIGIRKGLIPIYIAVVLHEYKREVIISDSMGQVLLSADTLLQINSKPEQFYLSYLDWNSEKEAFVQSLSDYFAEFIVGTERGSSSYDYVVSAMLRWHMSLPKYTKESKILLDGGKIKKDHQNMLKLFIQNISGNELLFEKLPKAFGLSEFQESVTNNIKSAKDFYDNYLSNAKKVLCKMVKQIFVFKKNSLNINKMSLSSVIKDWCETLDQSTFEQLFADGTERCLGLFKNITNDDDLTISRLAKLATDLRIEDWSDNTRELFIENIKRYKDTAENHQSTKENEASSYQISFADENGAMVTKYFEHTENTKKGKLLYNQVTAALDSMGHSISNQEKRQVLMEILKALC